MPQPLQTPAASAADRPSLDPVPASARVAFAPPPDAGGSLEPAFPMPATEARRRRIADFLNLEYRNREVDRTRLCRSPVAKAVLDLDSQSEVAMNHVNASMFLLHFFLYVYALELLVRANARSFLHISSIADNR